MGRIIGIRNKKINYSVEKYGELKWPVQICILEEDSVTTYEIETDDPYYGTPEIDWVKGEYPVEYRQIEDSDDLSKFHSHYIKWRELLPSEDPQSFPSHLLMNDEEKWYYAYQVPVAHDGLQPGDTIAMLFHRNTNWLTSALSKKGKEISVEVYRVPFFRLKNYWSGDINIQAKALAELARDHLELFYRVTERDRDLILLQEFFGVAKFGHEQQVIKIVKRLDVYQKLFGDIPPIIAAELIAAIGDIRKFERDRQLKAFCGVHVVGGRFPSIKTQRKVSWHPGARRALFVIGNRFLRLPDSEWGTKLLEIKERMRVKHPKVEIVGGGKRYTDEHIKRMAMWRTLTKYVEWVFKAWWKLERERLEE